MPGALNLKHLRFMALQNKNHYQIDKILLLLFSFRLIIPSMCNGFLCKTMNAVRIKLPN